MASSKGTKLARLISLWPQVQELHQQLPSLTLHTLHLLKHNLPPTQRSYMYLYVWLQLYVPRCQMPKRYVYLYVWLQSMCLSVRCLSNDCLVMCTGISARKVPWWVSWAAQTASICLHSLWCRSQEVHWSQVCCGRRHHHSCQAAAALHLFPGCCQTWRAAFAAQLPHHLHTSRRHLAQC